MKQAIQEGFILDVLRHYTPVESYYKLIKTVEERSLSSTSSGPGRSCAATWRTTIKPSGSRRRSWWTTSTSRCWPDCNKIGGQGAGRWWSRAGIRAGRFSYLLRHPGLPDWRRKSPYRAIAAFSGEHEHDGAKVTEASLNGFSSEPDCLTRSRKSRTASWSAPTSSRPATTSRCCTRCTWTRLLSGVKAVQTLSRLNRAHPQEARRLRAGLHANDADTIQDAFADYYRTTVLSGGDRSRTGCTTSRPTLDGYQIYDSAQRWTSWWTRYLGREPTVTGSIPSWTPVSRSIGSSWTRTARWTSRARRRPSSGPTASWRLNPALHATPSGRSSPSS